jgi:hypothetical protein
VVALIAAALTLALGVGSVAAARPGGPLYGARIWAETLTLPTTAAERAAAEIRRLNERLAEAANAFAGGDANGADAALAAYDAIVAEATAGANADAVADATLNAGVRQNIEVLTALLARVPEQAQDAIQHAIQQSSSAVDQLRGQPGVDGRPVNPGSGPATNQPTHSANPNKPTRTPATATPKPHARTTPKPHPTPRPRPTPEPAAVTTAPEHNPRASGRPSSQPGNANPGD